MVGLLFQIILFSIASAQDRPIGQCNCEPCKYVPTGRYSGTWDLVNKISDQCWDQEKGWHGCLYKNGPGEEMCFCDPGPFVYELCSGSGSGLGCYTAQTPLFKVNVANDFKQFDVDCSRDALSQFQVTNPSGDGHTFQYNYTCCPFNERYHEDLNTANTKFDTESPSIYDISLQNVTCTPGSTVTFIERFQQVSKKEVDKMHYALRCGFMLFDPVCIQKQTPTHPCDGYIIPDILPFDVACPTDYQFLYQFKLEAKDNKGSYHYTCCHQG